MYSIRFTLAAIVLSFLFATAALLPHGLQRLDATYPFQGIGILGIDAEGYYAARVHEIDDGFWSLGNAYYSDLKDAPFVQPPLPEWTIAMIGRMVGMEPLTVFVFCKGIFAFLLTLAMIGAFASITGRPWLSLVAVSLLLFANPLLNAPWDLPAILRGDLSPGFLRFARPVNPQWPVMWFFLTLWTLSSWLQVRRVWKVFLAAALTLVLVYSYVYAWTYLAVSITLLLFWFLWRRDRIRSRDLCLLFLLCAIGSMPYLWHVWLTVHHPWYAESAMRQGLVHKRTMVLGVWALLFVPMSLSTRRFWPRSWPLLPMLSIGGLLVLNQQLVTGSSLVPHHYHWYFIQPLACITALVLLLRGAEQYLPRKIFMCSLTVLTVLSVMFGFWTQRRAYTDQRVIWGERQHSAPLLHFLSTVTHPGIVVTGTQEGFVDEIVPIYTSGDTYATLYANLFLVPKSRTEEIFFFRLWLLGITPAEADRRLPTDLRSSLSSGLYGIYYREAEGNMLAIPNSDVSRMAHLYQKYFALSLDQKLALHPLDFIVLGKGDPETPAFHALRTRGHVVYTDTLWTVLSVPRPPRSS